ncbi:MAG TPA: protein translocase subunit SecF [Gemmatimonadales bacterium]|jgi:preprotein translocase subunit SecF|nr:protein translocase subunit SecF [Gemmatimonadales bacterium]
MIRLFANANYDFIKWRRWAFSLTGAIMLVGLGFLVTRGLNYSIEFTGGTLVQVELHRKVATADLRTALDNVGLRGADIQTFGSDTSYVIRARLTATSEATGDAGNEAVTAAVGKALDQSVGPGQYTILRHEAVGPKVGRELQGKAFMAILLSFVVTLIYLAFRFEWRFGLAAVVATAHDVVATIAFISVMHLEVSLIVVGAVLTVVGYSLNDTIIIFDRVRENLRKYRRQNLYEILNLSINETLPRSVLTHGTTIATTLALLILAGEVIRPFAWVMSFGIFTGTFSSIYIAAPVLLWIEKRWPGEDARGARAFGSRAPATPSVPAPPATPPSQPRTPQPAR